MQSYQRLVLLLGSSVLACSLGSSRASAYCQTTTSEQQVTSCSDSCVTDGYPLAWPSNEITYYFNDKGFPGLSDTKLRGIFADAFGAWQDVTCDGEPVGLDLVAAAETTSLTVGPKASEPNESVISHLSGEEWLALDIDPRAFALTAIWFDANSGRILGADMHFNGGMDAFGVCPESGCTPAQRLTDLPNVATHEAGHFLGLAHSQSEDSTMWCDAQGNETNKRTLSADDAAGMCKVYPRGIAFTDDYFPTPSPRTVTKSNNGCSVSSVPGSTMIASSSLGLFVLGFVLRRRKR